MVANSRTDSTTETAIDPRQPKRLEKNRNTRFSLSRRGGSRLANSYLIVGIALIGVAGWAVRKEDAELFPEPGTHLQRYASVFNSVEINSSFYKPHQRGTYERWAAGVPAAFRFAVKMPKVLTHERRLERPGADLPRFLDEAGGLGVKLGCVLVQLPPSLAYHPRVVESFLAALRQRHTGHLVFEPRHPTWFTGVADERLAAHRVARVAADPLCHPSACEPGGWPGVTYYRLHGSPVMYHSSYDEASLKQLASRLIVAKGTSEAAWCIFDNTARGAATANAMSLLGLLRSGRARPKTAML